MKISHFSFYLRQYSQNGFLLSGELQKCEFYLIGDYNNLLKNDEVGNLII